jgi:hypothetical protein
MSDIGELRLADIYRGLSSQTVPTVDETRMDARDSENLSVTPTYTDSSTGTTKQVTATDKNKLIMGMLGFVLLIGVLGLTK